MPSGYKHGDTPKKALVRGTISYLESQGLPVNKSAIFRHFELSRSQGYAALSLPASKRNDPEWEETRGRPSKISEADQRRMEAVLWDDDGQPRQPPGPGPRPGPGPGRDAGAGLSGPGLSGPGLSGPGLSGPGLNWAGLARAAGVETACNPRTLHRAMGTLGYRRCLACGRSAVHRRCRDKRLDYARRTLAALPRAADWRSVRFSVELHFGFGLDGRVRLLPRAGEKRCPACAAAGDAWPRDVRRVHAWAAAGYGFKSELVFYEPSTSATCAGTMTMADYVAKILEGPVKAWLATSAFVLEEDGEAFAHGGLSKANAVQRWKDAAGLRHFFSPGDCPDLSPLDALWPAGKQWRAAAGALVGWDEASLRAAAREAWDGLAQERIDVWVDVMPQRLQQVLDGDGQLVPW